VLAKVTNNAAYVIFNSGDMCWVVVCLVFLSMH